MCATLPESHHLRVGPTSPLYFLPAGSPLLLRDADLFSPSFTLGCQSRARAVQDGAVLPRRRVIPPAPRLVGIELNPGPFGRSPVRLASDRDLVRDAAAAVGLTIGNAVGGATKRAAAKKKKKPMMGKKAALTRGGGNGNLQSNVTNNIVSQAPTSMIPIIRSDARGGTVCRQAFSVASMPVCTSPSGVLSFGGTTSTFANLSLDPTLPITGTGSSGTYVFGYGIATLGNFYREYRITKLRCRYLAQVQPVAGSICIAYSPDGAITTTSASSYSLVSSTNGNVTFPVWQNAELPLINLQKQWLYTADGATQSDNRMGNIGTILAQWLNQPASSQVLGVLEFSGVIEFRGLGSFPATITPMLPQNPPTTSVPTQNCCERKEPENSFENVESPLVCPERPLDALHASYLAKKEALAANAGTPAHLAALEISYQNKVDAVQRNGGGWFSSAAPRPQ